MGMIRTRTGDVVGDGGHRRATSIVADGTVLPVGTSRDVSRGVVAVEAPAIRTTSTPSTQLVPIDPAVQQDTRHAVPEAGRGLLMGTDTDTPADTIIPSRDVGAALILVPVVLRQ